MDKIKEAYREGYRVRDDGSVKGIKVENRSLQEGSNGYLKFNFGQYPIAVHRLQAYQKFGEMMFGKDTEVRHLDGNKKNNSWNNIGIGTHSDNQMDIPKKIRTERASNPKYPHKKIINYYKENDCTYKDLMDKFNISSKGAISFIINNSLESK